MFAFVINGTFAVQSLEDHLLYESIAEYVSYEAQKFFTYKTQTKMQIAVVSNDYANEKWNASP